MNFKQCKKCGEVKRLGKYYRDRSKSDGFANICKFCAKKKNDAWRRKNPDYMREYAKQWSEQTYQKSQATKMRYRKMHPARVKANRAVTKAVGRGKIKPIKTRLCIDCQQPAKHYHHESYKREDWLNVIPLCQPCHKKRHSVPI